MSIWKMFLGALLMLSAFMPWAYGVGLGGGTSASVGEGQVQGALVANENGAVSTVSSTGQVTLGQPIYVEDSTGKHCEVMLDVVNGRILGYRAEFSPGEGNVSASNAVSVKQKLSVRDADKITADAKAWNAEGDLASVDIQVGRVGVYGAEFMGETDSSATADSAVARSDGDLKGSLLGLAMAGPLVDEARDSNGGIVDCDMLMKARSAGGNDIISGKAIFDVDPGIKIQSAVDAALDGDLIKVAPGTYNENIEIDKSLTIRGAGKGSTIVDGGEKYSVFNIGRFNPGADVALSGMTIQNGIAGSPSDYTTNGGGIWNNGTLSVKNCKITGNGGGMTLGGGIYNSGVLSVKNSEISNNTAYDGSGGGIYNNAMGTATVERCQITGNIAESGGGISNSGNLVVRDSKISKNIVGTVGIGGGIANTGTAAISGSEISGNTAWGAFGGAGGSGIWNSGTLTVRSCRIFNNALSEYSPYEEDFGGGIYNRGTATVIGSIISGNKARLGGGIYNSGALGVTNSLIIRNNASINGGGIYNDKGTISLIRSTVRQNKPNDVVSVP